MRLPLALLALAAPPALAQNVSAADPQSIIDAMRANGHKAALSAERQDSGAPIVNGGVNGLTYGAFFQACENGANCQDILFSASFDLETPLTLDYVNDWNFQRTFGTLTVNDAATPSCPTTSSPRAGCLARTSTRWWPSGPP
jgi:hypothetical protein